jgi:aspartate/methionine/tyrosine aminotransferase
MSTLNHSEGAENPALFDGFTSALSISNMDTNGDLSDNIHVTYGAAKDFGMGGMRLGFLATRNQNLKEMIGKLG